MTAEVRGDPATEVMSSRNNRGRFLGEIEAGLEAGGVDVREALGKVAFGYLCSTRCEFLGTSIPTKYGA